MKEPQKDGRHLAFGDESRIEVRVLSFLLKKRWLAAQIQYNYILCIALDLVEVSYIKFIYKGIFQSSSINQVPCLWTSAAQRMCHSVRYRFDDIKLTVKFLHWFQLARMCHLPYWVHTLCFWFQCISHFHPVFIYSV